MSGGIAAGFPHSQPHKKENKMTTTTPNYLLDENEQAEKLISEWYYQLLNIADELVENSPNEYFQVMDIAAEMKNQINATNS